MGTVLPFSPAPMAAHISQQPEENRSEALHGRGTVRPSASFVSHPCCPGSSCHLQSGAVRELIFQACGCSIKKGRAAFLEPTI